MLFHTPAAALLLLQTLPAICADLSRPYPLTDSYLQTTSILDHASYVAGFDDPQWYLDNIPFIDVPDQSLQDVYYYRASVIKRHIKWSHEGQGWGVTEFIHPVAWASKLQTVPDSAGHHMVELRWLRDTNYIKNLIEQYTRGGVEKLSGITYTHYVQRAILEHAQATGDIPWLISQLDGMIMSYNLWNVTIDPTTGLYHRNPLQDAQEYSLPGFLTGGPGGGPMQVWNDFGLTAAQGGGNDYTTIWLGPETYRPSHNSYMVANARAISTVATLAGNTSLATQWADYAEGLYTRMEDQMYSDELNFWIDVVEGTNLPCEGRELIGYFPYRFDVGTNATQLAGLEAGLTPEHFLTEFGPTTLEQDNPYYTALKNTTYCCIWNGQSWPFSTSVYLGTLARIARAGISKIVTPDFFNQELTKYTLTNYKAGIPYTAESHYPTIDMWSGDTGNHSEHYLHSTYLDNVFTNLFGIVPTFGDTLVLQPLVPSNWSYFAIENLPYHGSLLTFVYDKTGTHYSSGTYSNSSAGLSIYSNGTLFHHQSTLAAANITLPFKTAAAAEQLAAQPEWQNIVANPNSPWNLPSVAADYELSLNGDVQNYQAWKMNDGLLWYDTTPDNRWTSNQSTTPYNNIYVTLPRARNISSVSLAIMGDTDRGGVIACPAGIKVTDRAAQTLAFKQNWTECVPNALNTIFFAAPTANNTDNATTPNTGYEYETDYLVITLSDQLDYATAVTEVQIWIPPVTGPRWEAEDGLIGNFIGSFEGTKSGLNGTIENGVVSLGTNGWVEVAGVRNPDNAAGPTTLTVIGGGAGTVTVQLNWLVTQTVTFSGTADEALQFDFLKGANTVTIIQVDGTPFIDAIVVG